MQELAISYPGTNIIGSGGNINKLYRLAEKKDKKKQRITVEVLHKLHESLNKLSVEERMEKYQLKPDRADVIVPAGNIFLTIADIIHATHIYVPVIGLADGIIDGLYASHLEEKQKILGILPSKKMLRTHLKIRKSKSYFSDNKNRFMSKFLIKRFFIIHNLFINCYFT